MSKTELPENIRELFSIMEAANEREYIGESVSQLEHSLQAAHFARKANKDPEVILACLFHDIGHLCAPDEAKEMDGLGVVDHEGIGAQYLLSLGFPERVAELVGAHVQAKRYLVTKKKGYLENLSPASRGTLDWQGGPMSPQEINDFENDPLFEDKLFVRVCDERAKVIDLKVAPLDYYKKMTLTLL